MEVFQKYLIPFKLADKAHLNIVKSFYYLLQKLLKKRGRDDFVKIK